jgi:hypothetical protein
MKLGFAVPAIGERSKTPGARRSSPAFRWHQLQMRGDFDLGDLRKHVENRW